MRTASRMAFTFRDRAEAGELLAKRLESYRADEPVVLGIPRGGVAVAAPIAERLGADLDIVVARKVGAPGAPELALGAVTANGGVYLNDSIVRGLAVSLQDLDTAIEAKRAEARDYERRLRQGRPAVSVRGRVVILVDDGLATGATARAAVRSLRKEGPSRLVLALPVGSEEACQALETEVDELLCLQRPEPFIAVGLYYDSFEQVESTTVQAILAGAAAERLQRARRAG